MCKLIILIILLLHLKYTFSWDEPLKIYYDKTSSKFYLIIDNTYCVIKNVYVVSFLGFNYKQSYEIDNIYNTSLKENKDLHCPIYTPNNTIDEGICLTFRKSTLNKIKTLSNNLHIITSVVNFGKHINPSIIPFLGQFIMTRGNYPQLAVIDENLIQMRQLEYITTSSFNWYESDYKLLKISDNKILLLYNNILDYPNAYVAYRELNYNSYDQSFVLTEPIKLDKKGLSLREKNWTPFIYNNNLYFITKVLSLYVYKLTTDPVYTTDFLSHNVQAKKVEFVSNHICDLYFHSSGARWEYGDIRGGTPAIYVPTYGFLSFFHSKYTILKQQHCGYYYFIGAYIFSAKIPFQLLKMSPQPIITSDIIYNPKDNPNHESRIYPMSFYLEDDNNKIINDDKTIPTTIVLSAGYNVTNGYSIRIDFPALIKSMGNVNCF